MQPASQDLPVVPGTTYRDTVRLVLADVAQGVRDFPSDDEAQAMMPAMEWPEEGLPAQS